MYKKIFLSILVFVASLGSNNAFCMKSKHPCINVKGERGWYSSRSDIEKYDKSFKKKIDEGKEVVEAVKEVKSENGMKDEPLLFWACMVGSAKMVEALLPYAKKEDITAFYKFKTVCPETIWPDHTKREITNHKKTLLYIALEKDWTDVFKVLIPEFKNNVAINLKSETNSEERINLGSTALLLAISNKKKQEAKLLVENGADANQKICGLSGLIEILKQKKDVCPCKLSYLSNLLSSLRKL